MTFRHPHPAEVSASFDCDWSSLGQWDIEAETANGWRPPREGDGDAANPLGTEYPRLYRRMADLVVSGASEVDLAPFVLVADAMMSAARRAVAPVHW